MKKRFLRVISACSSIFVLLSCPMLYSIPAGAADTAQTSGNCGADGDNLTWNLDDNGVLTISGSGKMADFGNSTGTAAPWTRSAVKKVILDSGVTSVGDYAFYYCPNLSGVTLPEGVTSIGDWAFSGGEYVYDLSFSLETLTLPESLNSIGNQAFMNLKSLSELNIPESVSFIGANALLNTAWFDAKKEAAGESPIYINSILIDASAASGDVVIPDGTKGVAGYAISGNKNVTSVTVPDSVTYLGDHAFEYCSNVSSVTLGSGLRSIGEYAFCGCNEMTTITIPAKVDSIGDLAFCAISLEQINVAASNPYFASADGVLYDKEKTDLICYPIARAGASYTVPKTVKTISPYAVYNSSALEEITLPDGLTEIGAHAFEYSAKLRRFTIPDSVTMLGEEAFGNCKGIIEMYVGSGIKTLPHEVFYNCTAMTSCTLSEGLQQLDRYAFCWCRSLESITLPDSVETIGTEVFWCCLALKSVHLGTGLTKIDEQAFYQCGELETINIPDGVTEIGEKAFYECTSLREIVIPESVTNLGNLSYGTTYSTGVFDGCTALESVTLHCRLYSLSNYLFNNCTSLKSLNIPETVRSIGSYTFAGCASLESLQLPAGLSSIGSFAFKDCAALSELTLPYGLYSIGKGAFSNCYGLTDIVIPESVSYINDEAFSGCVNLKTALIPEHVSRIGTDAFRNYTANQKYTYEFFALSEVGGTLYDGTSAVVYIRTKNPDPDSFYISTDIPYSSSSTKYADITYNNADDTHAFKAVEGGYIWAFTPKVSGSYHCMVIETEPDAGTQNIAAEFSVTVRNYDAAYYAWMDSVIASQTTAEMSNFEKMTAVSKYLLSTFKYLTNHDGKLVTVASEPNSPYFAAHHWDSYVSPSGLCQFALRIGGFDKVESLYSSYAQYGFSWSNGHYLCYCEADGKGAFYQACPLTPTGSVDLEPIDFTDPAQLYSLSDWNRVSVNHEALTIRGVPESAAEVFAEENNIRFAAITASDGDCNADGALTLEDVILLQKWLLKIPNTTLAYWKAADMDGNGRLNAADLTLMKRLLLDQ